MPVRRDGVEDSLDQRAWRAGLFMVNGGDTVNDFRFLTSVSRPAAPVTFKIIWVLVRFW